MVKYLGSKRADTGAIYQNGVSIRGPANVQQASWRCKLGARLERYLHYGAVIQMPGFMHKIEEK